MSMSTTAKIKAIAEILKKRFPNLTTDETVDLVMKIMEAIEEI